MDNSNLKNKLKLLCFWRAINRNIKKMNEN